MERKAIEGSSNINSVGYDKDTLILEIEFSSGEIYDYNDVPENVYNDFMDSPSKGGFFYKNIKKGYGYTKV